MASTHSLDRNVLTVIDTFGDTAKFDTNHTGIFLQVTEGGRKTSVAITAHSAVALRDLLNERFPVAQVEAVAPVLVQTDFAALEDRIMAMLTDGGANITINATGNVIVNNK